MAKTHLSSFSFSNRLIQPPWLMLPTVSSDPENSDHSHGFRFLNLVQNKFYNLKKQQQEEFVQINRIVGSSQGGWLVCLDEKKTPFLFNPFLDVCVEPCLVDTLPLITKAILWSDPIDTGNNYGIVAIYGEFYSRIAFAKCGDSHWTFLEDSYSPHGNYCDVICSKDYLFALSNMGSVEVWVISGDVPQKIMGIEAGFPEERMKFEESLGNLYSNKFYLVESQGEFLLVIRYIGEFVNCYNGEVVLEADCVDEFVYHHMTKTFRVYKLDFKKGMWRKLDSLGDQILFLGGNQSVSVSAREFPGYEGNSIYFTDDYWDRMGECFEYCGHDNGVFNLGDRCIKEIVDVQRIQPPPFWVIPSSVKT